MASQDGSTIKPPDPDEVRAELDRMVLSDVFRGSAQLVAFLRFVVEATLQGKQDRIKAYTIGVEVFRRLPKFDPQIDPIVRVEATRLRRTIDRYYAGPGADDPIIIELPRGSYVPAILRRRIERTRGKKLLRSLSRLILLVRSWPVLASMIVLGIITIAATTAYVYRQESPESHLSAALRPGNGMPNLIVGPFETNGSPDSKAISGAGLFEEINSVFSRFEEINVVVEPLPAGMPVDYRLRGAIEYHDDGTTSIRFSLLDVGEGQTVLSKSFDRLTAATDRAMAEDAIAGELAKTLLQPYGFISSREGIKPLAIGDRDPRYRCILETFDAIRSFEPDTSSRALACLEHLTSIYPGFSEGLALQSVMYNRKYLFGGDFREASVPEPDRILQMARRAIELTPTSAHAHMALAVILFSRRDDISAFAAADEALALNKYDPLVESEYGGMLILAGQVERGLNMMLGAGDDSVVRPIRHHFYLFLGNYLLGNLGAADREASQVTSNTYQLGLIARALVSAQNGERDKALQALKRLGDLQPAWRSDLHGTLEKFISAPTIVDRLSRDLEAAGLSDVK
jgi:tetratricopeptide (TPR) repeat protein